MRNKLTPQNIESVKDLLRSGMSIPDACKAAGFKYHGVLSHLKRDAAFFRSIKSRSGRRIKDESFPSTVAGAGVRSSVAAESAATIIINGLSFPSVIYRIWHNQFGMQMCDEGRFFFRLEALRYVVVGYEYPVHNNPLNHKCDLFCYDFNTDPNVALGNVNRILDELNGKSVDDEVYGAVQYSFVKPVVYSVKSKTRVNLPDGQYKAKLLKDQGAIRMNGMNYDFIIPTNVEKMVEAYPVIVKDNYVMISI